MSIRNLLRWTSWLALTALPACDVLLGANFDVGLRPVDGGISLDGGRDASGDPFDGGASDARSEPSSLDATADAIILLDGSNDAARDASDEGVRPDTGNPDSMDPDAGDAGAADAGDASAADADDADDAGDAGDADGADTGTDAGDAGTDVDGGFRPTIINGGFIYLGTPNPQPSPIELRGQIISNAIVRGTTSGGITIQGRFQ